MVKSTSERLVLSGGFASELARDGRTYPRQNLDRTATAVPFNHFLERKRDNGFARACGPGGKRGNGWGWKFETGPG